MKKLLAILLSLCIILLFPACSDKKLTAGPDEIVIHIDFSEVDRPIFRIVMAYFLDSDLMGGQACSHADMTELRKSANFILEKQDFPEESSLEDFSFHLVFCCDKEGIDGLFADTDKLTPTNECSAFTPEYGSVYYFKVTGTLETGLTLAPAEGNP